MITNTNLTAYYNNDLDPFAYIITGQFTSNKFYGVIINTKALKRLTVGSGQYLIYRKTYNTIINTLKAGTINV